MAGLQGQPKYGFGWPDGRLGGLGPPGSTTPDVPVLECPRNSSDLNPIENAWNYMKNKVQEAQSTNIQTLKEVLMKLWVPIYAEYFRKFVESMPNILHNVIKAKGHMTKY